MLTCASHSVHIHSCITFPLSARVFCSVFSLFFLYVMLFFHVVWKFSGVTLKTLTMWLSIDHTRSLQHALMIVPLMFFMAQFTLILIKIRLSFPWKFLEGMPAQMEEVSPLTYSLLFFYYCLVVSALQLSIIPF